MIHHFIVFLVLCLVGTKLEAHGITQCATLQPPDLNLHPLKSVAKCCNTLNVQDQHATHNSASASASTSFRPSAAAYDDWLQLIQCVNTSSVSHTSRVLKDKTTRIGFVTFATKNIWDYTAYSFAINQIYAEHQGYVFRHLDEDSEGGDSFDSRDSRWNKVKILEQAINANGWGSELDYVVWVDADVAILDMGLRIEDVVSKHPDAHILSSAEHAGSTTLINSGTVIVRVSDFSRLFLRVWWEFGDRSLFSDQEQFDLMYKFCEDRWKVWMGMSMGGAEGGNKREEREFMRLHIAAHGTGNGGGGKEQRQGQRHEVSAIEALSAEPAFDVHRKVAILPPDALNSDPPAMSQQKPYNQVLHLMGEHTAYRQKVFSAGLHELCSFIHQKEDTKKVQEQEQEQGVEVEEVEIGLDDVLIEKIPLKSQLGLNQANLLLWTLQVYGEESSKLLSEYAVGATKGKFSVPESRRLANAVHHYAHALIMTSGSGSDSDVVPGQSTAVDMRWQVWKLLSENIHGRRKIHTSNKVSADWPELLKVTAEAGQQLVSQPLLSIATRQEVAAQVSVLLQEILQICHKAQRPAVMHMVAHMYSESAMLSLQLGDNLDSLQHFHESLKLYRSLSHTTGTHILVQPLISLANALCTSKHYQQAFPLFEEAITLAEAVLGSRHESLSNHYLNYGIGKFEAGSFPEAVLLLQKAIHLLDLNMNTKEDSTREARNRAESYLSQAQVREHSRSDKGF